MLAHRGALVDLEQVRARVAGGESLRTVARSLGLHHTTLGRALERGAEAPLAGAPK